MERPAADACSLAELRAIAIPFRHSDRVQRCGNSIASTDSPRQVVKVLTVENSVHLWGIPGLSMQSSSSSPETGTPGPQQQLRNYLKTFGPPAPSFPPSRQCAFTFQVQHLVEEDFSWGLVAQAFGGGVLL